jgi:hypothetical protein
MMNWRVSFTENGFTPGEIRGWLEWVDKNQFPVTDIQIEEVPDHASHAEDHSGSVERQRSKRLGR